MRPEPGHGRVPRPWPPPRLPCWRPAGWSARPFPSPWRPAARHAGWIFLGSENFVSKKSYSQCCESGMIYSGSGYDFLEFRIGILPMLFKHIWTFSILTDPEQLIPDPDSFTSHYTGYSSRLLCSLILFLTCDSLG